MLTEGDGILVVEDDEEIRAFLAEVLEAKGYRVQTAADGQKALTCLRRNRRPALILLDLVMPVMNGWEFCEQQRQDTRWATIPLVFMSAVVDNLAREARQIAADGFLEKPVDIDALLSLVEMYSL